MHGGLGMTLCYAHLLTAQTEKAGLTKRKPEIKGA